MPLEKRHQHLFFHEKLEIITPHTHCLDHYLLTIYGNNQRFCKWGIIMAMKPWPEQQDTGLLIYRHCNIFPFLSLPSGQWFLGSAHENTGHPFTGFPNLFVRSCDVHLQLGFGKLFAENFFINKYRALHLAELFNVQVCISCLLVP